MKLAGKTALVTGASRGIGRAIARHLARLGANVAINYARSDEEAKELVEEIRREGGQAIAIKADISQQDQVESMIKEVVDAFGSLDILVNNAGINKDTLLMRMSEEDWDRVIDTNLKGVFLCTKAASKIMIKKRQGKIINISSVIGVIGNAGQSNYAAAKAGIIGFTKSVAKELAGRNIQVNAVAPGFIKTDMTNALPDKAKEAILTQIPMARYGEPEDVAYLVGFLASEESSYITGQVIHVDGGMVM